MSDNMPNTEDMSEEVPEDYYEHLQKYNDYLLENLEDLLA